MGHKPPTKEAWSWGMTHVKFWWPQSYQWNS